MTTFQDRLAVRFRRIITSSPDGVPPWLGEVAAGDDAGFFKPNDAPWIVHGSFTTLVGGIRALLVQAMHPGSLAGVAQHSRYESDALGRLAGTTRWLTIMTFGSRTAIEREARRVNAMHKAVRGTYDDRGIPREYQARDPHLLLWVHVAFTDSFLSTYQLYSGAHIDSDAYVGQWARVVEPLGLEDAPRNYEQLEQCLRDFDDELVVSDLTLDVVRFIRKPPLSRTARIAYWFLFQGAVASLPSSYRNRLKLRCLPQGIVFPTTRMLLRIMRLAVGPRSPLEEAAIERLNRIGAV
jgi:uncharacterized protein (DUF2236 family)